LKAVCFATLMSFGFVFFEVPNMVNLAYAYFGLMGLMVLITAGDFIRLRKEWKAQNNPSGSSSHSNSDSGREVV